MNKDKPRVAVFWKSTLFLGVIFIIGIGLTLRGTKDKKEFFTCKGKIVSVTDSFLEYPLKNKGQYKYLQMDCYAKPFQIYLGSEKKLDVNEGDILEVYFDDNDKEAQLKINRLIQFIDKDGVSVFVKGPKDKIGGIVAIVFSLVFFGVLLFLKIKVKIIS